MTHYSYLPKTYRSDKKINGNVTLYLADADHIPYFEHFDVVGAFDVIEHIDDDEAGHKRLYCGNELALKVGEAGFQVIWNSCFMAMLFLPQLLSRRLLTRFASRKSIESENMLPTPINGLLEGVLSIELALLRLGLRFPFGGTKIVAAREVLIRPAGTNLWACVKCAPQHAWPVPSSLLFYTLI